MTKQLEQIFDLPEMSKDEVDRLNNDMQTLEELDAKVPTITDLSGSDAEMDALAKKATDSFDDLMTLGMNVEARFAAPIFDAASKMLGHAVTAKTAKLEKKLKAIDLELKRQRQQHQMGTNDETGTVEGEARVLDRNELLRMLKGDS